MTGVVIFDSSAFCEMYPQFSAYNSASPTGLQGHFDLTALYLNNSPRSPVRNLAARQQLLWLLTAHLATLAGVLTPGGAGSSATQVGRISQAAEGTVSASFDAGPVTANSAWFMQTQYGAMYWQGTANFRQMRYVPPTRR